MTPQDFIDRWQDSGAAELANSQTFLMELCDLLDVPPPHRNRRGPKHGRLRKSGPAETTGVGLMADPPNAALA